MAVNVLIVDDSAVMRAMIQKTMKLSGLQLGEIHQASNGREGLRYQPSPVVTARLGIAPAHLEKVASQTLQWANELSQALAA